MPKRRAKRGPSSMSTHESSQALGGAVEPCAVGERAARIRALVEAADSSFGPILTALHE